MPKATVRGALGISALALLIGLGGGLAAGAASSPVVPPTHPARTAPGGNEKAGGQRINDPSAKAPAFQRNARGMTFGSAADAPRTDLEPDLIAVITNEGGTGYVYGSELDTPPPTSVLEAASVPAPRVLTAYGSDGVTPVGTFTVEGEAIR